MYGNGGIPAVVSFLWATDMKSYKEPRYTQMLTREVTTHCRVSNSVLTHPQLCYLTISNEFQGVNYIKGKEGAVD